MNKIYRLVWNKYLGLWTVVSELARGTTKKRNVSVNATAALNPPINTDSLYTKSHLTPAILATIMGSILYSSNVFAGYELNGGSTFTNCTSSSTGSGTESTNSLAFGPNACAPTNDSIAIGRAASTQSVGGVSNQSISIGAFSRAGGDQSVALGANTRATGNSSVAIGGDDVDRLANNAALRTKYNQITGGTIVAGQYPTTTAMQGSTAVGVQASATGDFASAYGMTSKATGDASAAFGVQANASGLGAVAFGAVAQATGNGSAALGVNATASANNATAIGSGNTKATAARATALGATAVGNLSLASGVGAAAIGRNTRASGDRSIALGDGSQSTANGTAAFGVNANASADKAIAIGSGETPDTAAKASAVDATAIGNRSVSSGVGSAAIGRAAQATGDKALALGDAAQAVTSGDMAVGDAAYARSGVGNISAIALGRTSRADGNNTLAIGNAARATDNFAAAIGNAAEASADNAIAVGNSAKASGNLSSALGNNANASGLESSAMGNGAVASGDYALATGSQAQATASETVAIGHLSKAQSFADIAIGSDAATATGTGGKNIAIGNKVTTGAIGQNVAIGSGTTTANAATANGGAVSIGRDQIATGDGAVAIGDPNTSNGDGALAIGKDNTAAGNTTGTAAAKGAVALGNTNQAIGQGSVAIGSTSTAAVAGAIALGDTAAANGGQSVSIGSNSLAVQAGDIAVGADAYTAGKVVNGIAQSAAAFGLQSRADGATALAVGNNAQATADYAGALGNAAVASALEASAVGNRAQATKDYSTAVGTNATASGLQSTALGNRSKATGDFSISQGNNTEASGVYSTAVGNFSKATGESAIAVGDLAIASASDATAIGTRATASGVDANAIGIDSRATGNTAVALGAGATASANNALATGVGANAAAASAVALGDSAQAQSANDIAIGRTAATQSGTTGDNIAIGNAVTTGATGKNVAIGSDGTTANSESADGGAVAIGREQVATGDGAVAIGDPNRAAGSGAVALGKDNTAAGDTAASTMASGAVAIGNTNQAIGQGSVALGNTSIAAAAGAIALGDTANAQATRGVALGSGATATNPDDVALGAGSVTSAANPTANGTVGGITYDYAGTTPSSVVSVGSAGNERQITNVAAGRVSETSTDAINGSQLYSTQQALGNLADSTANHLGGGSVVNPDGSVSAPNYIVNETPINNVGDAIEALDQGWNLQSNGAGAGAIKAGDTVDIGTVNGEENLTVTKDGNTIQYGLNRNLKVDSVTAGDTVINTNGVTINNGPSITKSGIDAAGNIISNVGAGVAGTDAVNKSQLDAATAAGKNTVSQGKNITISESTNADGSTDYKVATADNVEFNNVAVGDVTIDGATGKISGVTAGDVTATSTDAINGSQLAGTAKSVSDALGGGSVVNPDGTVTAPSYEINGNTMTNVGAALTELDKGWNLQSNGANAGAVKAGDTVDIGTVNGEENLSVTKDGNTIQYGLNRNLNVDSVRAGDTLINDNGVTISNGPSFTKDGINAAGNPITNVAAGVNDTDAVNKGQLDDAAAAAKTEVTQGKNITVSKTTGANGQDIYNVATADNVEFNNVEVGDVTIDGTTGKISGVTAGDVNATSTDAINGSQLAGTAKSVSDALGGGSTVNPDGTVTAPSYEINGNTMTNVGAALTELDKGWNLQSNGANAGAVKAGDTVDIGTVNGEENLTVTKDGNTIQYGLNKNLRVDSVRAGDTLVNDNGVTITNGPSITKSGINAAGNPISNVGAGVNDSDAVNKGQLDDAAAAAKTEVTQGKNITVSKTTGADGQDIYNVATADNVEFNNVTVGDVTIDGTTGKISGVTAGEVSATSDEAINGSQLAGTAKSVSDALGGGSTVNPDGTVTAPSYTVNGNNVSNVGAAISELDKGWNLQSNGANAGAVKAGDTVDIGTVAGEENLSVTKDGNTIQYSLNRNLNVDSVRAGDTLVNDNGVTITNGPSITKSGINAAGNPISNVGAGVNDSDAVNKGQLDDAAAAAKTEVTQGKNITVSKTTGANGQDIYNVATADNVDFNNVEVGDVTIDGTTGKITGVADGTVAAGSKDAVNGGQLHGVADSVRNSIGGETILNPDGSITTGNVGNTGQNNIHDAIDSIRGTAVAAKTTVTEGDNIVVTESTNADGSTNYEVATARDVDFDSVQVGDVNIDGTTGKITGVADGTVAAGSKDAVNGGQLNDSVASTGDILGGGVTNAGGRLNGPFTVNDKGYDTVADAIQGEAAAAKTEVEAGKNMTVESRTGADGQTIYEVATADDVSFDSVQVGDVNIDGTTGKISGVADGTVAAGSKEAVNGGQLHGVADSVRNSIGGETVLNPNGSVTTSNVGNTGQNNIHDAIDSIRGTAVAAKTTVTEGDNIVVTESTNPDGSTNYEVATAGDVDFDSVQVGDVNIDGTTGKITGVADGTIAAGSKDAVNGGQLNDSVASTGDILGGGVTNEGGRLNGPFTVNDKGYDTVADAIQGEAAAAKTEVEAGKNMTVESRTGADGQTIYEVATADDVDFNNVTVGGADGVRIDGTTGKISGVTDGTIAAGSKEAVNGGQLHGVADSVRNSIGGETVLNPNGSVTTSNVGNTGENNIHDAIDSVRGQAVAAKTTVTEGDNMVVMQSTNPDGSTNYEVATARDVDFDSVQVGDVNIDGTTGKITGVADGTVAAGSKEAINGGQLNDSVASTGDILGGGVINEGSRLNGPFTVNDKGYDTVADAIQGEAAAAKTEVEAGKNMTVESRTGADGQTIYEVATADDVSFDSVQVGDVNIDGTTGKISGVTDGTIAAGSKEAVNGGQLHGVADSVRNSIGGETVLNPNGSVITSNVGNTGENNIHDAIDSVRGQAVAAKTTVTEGDNIVVTESTNPDGSTNYDVATAKDVKFDSVTSTDAEGNETLLDAKGVSLKDQDGNTTILGQDGLGFADPMGNSVGPRISARGIDAGNTVITGVAPGRIATDSQDAINGSQLKGVADSVAGAIGGSTTVNPDGSITTSNIGGTGKDNINDAIGAVGKAAQAAKTTVSKADGDENVTVTSRANNEGGTDFQVGLSKDIKVDSVTAGDTVLNDNGLTIAGGPSVTKDGIDAGDNKVTGVADGTVAAGSKEAVNGGQLHGVADSVKNVVGGNATVNPDGSITTSNVGGTGENNIDDAINSVRGAAAAAKSSVSNKDGNISVIPTTKNDGSKDYEVGLAKDIRVDSVTAANQVNVGGAEGTTIAADGVRIVDGPSMTKGGINASDKKVTGVADGAIAAESKDAINGSQLHKSYENVGNALGGGAGYDPSTGWKGPSYEVAGGTHNNVGDALNALNSADQALGDRITNLGDQMQQAFYDTNQRIDDVKKMANAGVAAAMALETAPYISGKYTYAVGAAYHGGENAVGVTLRKTADNGRWSLTTGVAAASQGDPSFRVGLSGVFD
ncbi:ESPR-type extended signal peptide-containing protein [Acinetobacter proteolyticus]|uniref:ESPR-type extended signal peptide-containing protein n=1 Tax=Acinetobacter proteolyticus TaxID=1776741 RepID=UPI003D981305